MITSDLKVLWQKGEKENTWSAVIANQEAQMSELIGRIVVAHKIMDMSIKEISTEEIIRNIYEKGNIAGGY